MSLTFIRLSSLLHTVSAGITYMQKPVARCVETGRASFTCVCVRACMYAYVCMYVCALSSLRFTRIIHFMTQLFIICLLK